MHIPATTSQPCIGTTASSPSATTLSPPVSNTGGEYRFNFGKHHGKTLDETPRDYIQWCINAGVVSQRRDLRQALEQHQTEHQSSSPALLSIPQRFQAVAQKVPAWLYAACDKAFDEVYEDEMQALWDASAFRQLEHKKLEALEEMANLLAPFYLPRPPPPPPATLPDSDLVADLRSVLSLLPKSAWDIDGPYDGMCANGTNSVYVHFGGFTGTHSTLLTRQRRAEIKNLLNLIEEKHGKEVRVIAQWEVYDKVTESIGGIGYSNALGDEKGFYDTASEWVTV
ncbi:hypothetical protein BDY19DRAFT_993230 [Irpex rosettiformis]|uniref:Uncharacterized protein n=1 Tax=Irpex rosettiformis TaxID=378272 RepID=A0ACB8U607_9APHY|nr:hypothetical protein BDY19DRAFT_993230 [Irpex rosettiformis]